jgi:hypothetical protein
MPTARLATSQTDTQGFGRLLFALPRTLETKGDEVIPTSVKKGVFVFRTACLIPILLNLAAMGEAQDKAANATNTAITASARNFSFKPIAYDGPPQQTSFGTHYDTIAELRGINDAGVILGIMRRYQEQMVPFVYESGKYTYLNGPLYQGHFTVGLAINNRGQVLIAQDPQNGKPVSYFLYDMVQKTFSPLGSLVQVAGAPDKTRVSITGLNDSGQFVGIYNSRGKQYGGYGTLPIGPAGSTTPPVELGSFAQIACPDGRDMNANSLNNHEQVTGSCGPVFGPSSGFLSSDGKVTLFKYPDADLTMGKSINDAGGLVGLARINPPGAGVSATIGFAYDGSQFSPVVTCGDFSLARGFFSAANSLNNTGIIVGTNCGSHSGDFGFMATFTGTNPLQLTVTGRTH